MTIETVLRLAFAFDPAASFAGGMIAAVVLTRSRTAMGVAAAIALVVVAWGIGEGIAEPLLTGTLAAQAEKVGHWAYGLGAAGALGVGYVFPAWAGSFVGRRVVWGTGWLSAAAVAAMATSVASVFASRIQ